MQRLLFSLILTVAAFTAVACRVPPPVPNGFLPNYSALERKPKYPIYFSNPSLNPAPATHILVFRDVQWLAGDGAIDPELQQEILSLYKQQVRIWLAPKLPSNIFIKTDEKEVAKYYNHPAIGVMYLDFAIVDVHTGFGPARWAIGFGLGDAKLTVEAKVAHSQYPPDTLHQVSVYTHFNGGSHSGLNPKVFSDRYTMRRTVDFAAFDMANHLVELIRPAAGEWWQSMSFVPQAETKPAIPE